MTQSRLPSSGEREYDAHSRQQRTEHRPLRGTYPHNLHVFRGPATLTLCAQACPNSLPKRATPSNFPALPAKKLCQHHAITSNQTAAALPAPSTAFLVDGGRLTATKHSAGYG